MRRAVLALLLALATIYATSWLAVLLPSRHAWRGPPTTPMGHVPNSNNNNHWLLARGDEVGHTLVYAFSNFYLIWAQLDDGWKWRATEWEVLPRHLRADGLNKHDLQVWLHSVGWPMHALSCSIRSHLVNYRRITYTVRGGIRLPTAANAPPRSLPVTPVWPGFLVNTAIYCLVWFGALTSSARLCEHRRRKHNLCAACKYDRTGLSADIPCPECGRARL